MWVHPPKMTFVAAWAKTFANDVWNESKQQGDVYLPLRDTSSSWRWSSFDKGAPTSRDFLKKKNQKQLCQHGITQHWFVLLISVGWETTFCWVWYLKRINAAGRGGKRASESSQWGRRRLRAAWRNSWGQSWFWFNRFRRIVVTAKTLNLHTDVSTTMCTTFESFWRVQTSFICLSCQPFQTKLNGFFFCSRSTFFGFCLVFTLTKKQWGSCKILGQKNNRLAPPFRFFSLYSQNHRRQFDATLQRSETYLSPTPSFLWTYVKMKDAPWLPPARATDLPLPVELAVIRLPLFNRWRSSGRRNLTPSFGEKKLNLFETSQKSWSWLFLWRLVVKGG